MAMGLAAAITTPVITTPVITMLVTTTNLTRETAGLATVSFSKTHNGLRSHSKTAGGGFNRDCPLVIVEVGSSEVAVSKVANNRDFKYKANANRTRSWVATPSILEGGKTALHRFAQIKDSLPDSVMGVTAAIEHRSAPVVLD